MKKVLIVDGQGGKIGRGLVSQLVNYPELLEITAVGTNSMATANMIKGGAVRAATGENSIVVMAAHADIIAGPLGIIIADALLGEITPKAACAVSSSPAVRVLIPMNKCENIVVGVQEMPLSAMIDAAVKEILRISKDEKST